MSRGNYWNHIFECPFYTSNEKLTVVCENRNTVRFYNRDEAKRYIEQYCASKHWKDCTIAKMLHEHYEN